MISLFDFSNGEEAVKNDISSPSSFPSSTTSTLPSVFPTVNPSTIPTFSASFSPSHSPTWIPSVLSSQDPSVVSSIVPTLVPSLHPSIEPSVAMSENPSVAMSENPTVLHSAAPSLLPSAYPTNIPSHTPSIAASVIPSIMPSLDPTSFPSLNPTESPTVSPSLEPSNLPSSYPSSIPTLYISTMPSMSPSKYPSGNPTTSPSFSPSSFSSSQPSLSPSSFPTLRPSSQPTSHPSFVPSVLSSLMPTMAPSVIPSISSIPSISPTAQPSYTPSLSPSTQPSSYPTNIPTAVPTSLPSSSPTLQQQFDPVSNILMEFDDCSPLEDNEKSVWEQVTRDHIVKEINSLDLDLIQLQVNVTLRAQCVLPFETCTGDRRLASSKSYIPPPPLISNDISNNISSEQFRLHRTLQSKEPLRIFFDVSTSFRSTNYQHNFTTYVTEAFNNIDDRSKYIVSLQQRDNVFGPINVVSVKIGERTFRNEPDRGTTSTEIAIIAGGAVSGILVMGLAGFYYRRRRKRDWPEEPNNRGAVVGKEVTAIVNFDRQSYDDISTIGDPIYPGGMSFAPAMQADSDSVAGTYDYANMYGGTGEMYSASSAGASTNVSVSRSSIQASYRSDGSSTMKHQDSFTNSFISNDLFSDDTSFEKQYGTDEQRIEVRAPPGKLGMVIDAPNGGMPIVHAIRDNSVLVDKIRIGDKLISVDGEDTTNLSAMVVSKMISRKASNPTRTLVFSRSKQGAR